jgi:tetratricopeptide (TPR) repeat protein
MQALVNKPIKKQVNYAKKAVLIIEDFAEFGRALKGMVINMGARQVDLIYNGEDAIQACREKKYDIILSDYNLGDSKDGQQILEELNHFKLIKSNCVFIMTTAENTAAMVMGALEFQPDNYLTKPFNSSILKSRLDKAIIKKDILAPIVIKLKKQQWQEAIQLCDQVIESEPKFKMSCLRHKFECYKAMKNHEKALELATQIIHQRAISWAMLGAGEVFYAKNQLQRSAEVFSDMIKEFPMVLEGYDWLAKIQYELGQPIEAQKTLLSAVKRSPKALKRQKLLGQIAEENNDQEVVINAFRQAVKFGANSAFASPDEYIKLTRSIGMQAKNSSNNQRNKLIEEAETIFSKLDARFKSEPTVQFRSAVAHADFGLVTNSPEAVKKYLKSANKIYNRLEEHIGAAESIEITRSLNNLGDKELAESIIEEAVEQYFDNPEFIKEATKLTTNKHLIANSQKANQFNNKAVHFFKSNKYELAIENFSKAAEYAPNNININLNHVQTLLKYSQQSSNKRDTLEKAEELLASITRLSPADPKFARYSELSRLTQLLIQSM